MNSIQAPQELESRLRYVLQSVPVKKRNVNRGKVWAISAAAALLLFAGVYQYPALAYYGSKLFDREELIQLDFSELVEQGYGQTIDKTITLDDGTVITVDGVISDDNAFLMYYNINRVSGPVYEDQFIPRFSPDKLEGFLTNSRPRSGFITKISDDGKRVEGVVKFEPVSPFSRKLTVTFCERLNNGKLADHPLSFNFEANKAMKSIIKENLDQSVRVDKGKIRFDTFTASPTSTVVKGHYEMDYEGGPKFGGKINLYVNGTEVKWWGTYSEMVKGGVSGVSDFTLEFDVLPTDKIKELSLVVQNFSGYQKIEAPISLSRPSDRSIKVGPEKMWIRSVTRTDTGYDIVIARKQFVQLDTEKLSVQAGGTTVPVSEISSSRAWDLKNGNILWEQTYSFNTKEKPERLHLEGYHYIKAYNEKIIIPVDSKK